MSERARRALAGKRAGGGGRRIPHRRIPPIPPPLLSPDKAPLGAPFRIGGAASWHRLATDAYALHCLESPTGVRVALATDPGCGDARDVLAGVYALLADTRARHPGVGGKGGREVGPGFGARVDAYLGACGWL